MGLSENSRALLRGGYGAPGSDPPKWSFPSTVVTGWGFGLAWWYVPINGTALGAEAGGFQVQSQAGQLSETMLQDTKGLRVQLRL